MHDFLPACSYREIRREYQNGGESVQQQGHVHVHSAVSCYLQTYEALLKEVQSHPGSGSVEHEAESADQYDLDCIALADRNSNVPCESGIRYPLLIAIMNQWDLSWRKAVMCIYILAYTFITEYIEVYIYMYPVKKKGLSFISNRQRRKEGTFCASGLAGIEPTPPAPVEQGMRPSPTRLGGTCTQYILSLMTWTCDMQANSVNSSGCVRLDINLLKSSRIEFHQELGLQLTVPDQQAPSVNWLECVYRSNRTAHPVLRWLPTMDISDIAQMMPKRFAGKTILKGYKHCISSLGRLRWHSRYN